MTGDYRRRFGGAMQFKQKARGSNRCLYIPQSKNTKTNQPSYFCMVNFKQQP